ncbi:hypothetical protein PIB30_044417 [Stylosanthes scabra]|uniref:DUF4378 domain-containing protein n=1 Tax=Stylosanthes scabra TaxID=79078 RepID=A0ABU6ZEL7_9FABA|nr:hypothetical protein [Stylosanthes scabra]
MASSPKQERRLGEFLTEKQEPFILDLYLLERGYSKRWTSNSNSNNNGGNKTSTTSFSLCGGSKKKRNKSVLRFSKVLTALHKKLAFHNQKLCAAKTVHHDDDAVEETDRFSTASSSTVFNSCSDFDEDRNSSASQSDKPSSQHATNNGKHCQSCLEQGNQELNEDVSGMIKERRIGNCGDLAAKKITGNSLLSAALWSLLIQTAKNESYGYKMELQDLLGTKNVSQMLNSKGVLHKTKQVLFDCFREEELMGGEEALGRMICQWGQQVGDETKSKVTNLLTLDYNKSMSDWSKLEQHVKAISVEIAEGILEGVKDEIVSDMVQISDFAIFNNNRNRIVLQP